MTAAASGTFLLAAGLTKTFGTQTTMLGYNGCELSVLTIPKHIPHRFLPKTMYFNQASSTASAYPSHLQSLSRRRRSSRRPNAAFTLLELLLVLAILVVLGGVVLVNFSGTQDSSNVQATQIQLKEIGTAIIAYRIKMNGLPKSLDELKDGPSDAAKKARWTDSILKEIPKDAWGTEFEYSSKGNTYELRSAGLDGQMNSEDDIVQTGP